MGIDGTSSSMQHTDRRRIRPQTDARQAAAVALLLTTQRTRCTADAALMPLEGVRWALAALPPASSTQTADGCTAAGFDRRQAADLCPAADDAAHQMHGKPLH